MGTSATLEIGRNARAATRVGALVRSCCGCFSLAPLSASQKPRKHPRKASDQRLHFSAARMSDARGDLPHGEPKEKGAAEARSSTSPTHRKNQRACVSPYSYASRPCLMLCACQTTSWLTLRRGSAAGQKEQLSNATSAREITALVAFTVLKRQCSKHSRQR